MRYDEAKKELQKSAASRSLDLSRLRVADALDLMLGFYRDTPCEGCSRDNDGDMLLFQYGRYDWGRGVAFEIDFVRQFIVLDGGEYDGTEQLHITFHFAPSMTPDSESFTLWNCECTDDAEFEARVRQSPGFVVASSAAPGEIAVRQERV